MLEDATGFEMRRKFGWRKTVGFRKYISPLVYILLCLAEYGSKRAGSVCKGQSSLLRNDNDDDDRFRRLAPFELVEYAA